MKKWRSIILNFNPVISKIEVLLKEDTDASVTYAALECRLAIERICYERLRIAHDYISHEDLKKWQPSDVVRILIEEVDANTVNTFTLSVSTSTLPDGEKPTTLEEYRAMEYVPIGTQVGFNHKKLGSLWNALSNLALHVRLPMTKEDDIPRYGNRSEVKTKIYDALEEIRRIGGGTLLLSGMGEEVSFTCSCGSKNKRRLGLLADGQILSCVSPSCTESYRFVKSDLSFMRRTQEISCRACGSKHNMPIRRLEKLRFGNVINFDCLSCKETIFVQLGLLQAQRTNSANFE